MKKIVLGFTLLALTSPAITSAQGFVGPDQGPYEQQFGPPAYQDLLDRCQNIVTSLENAQAQAHMVLASGSFAQASTILQSAIDREFSMLPPPFASDYNPRTIEAIRVAKWISSEINKNTTWLAAKVGQHMLNEIRFNTLNHAVYIAIRAYYDIDELYFWPVYNSCRGGCLYPQLPERFRTGMQRLGSMYMDYAQTTGRGTGITELELMLSKVTVNSAKNFLARNTGRLNLACVVTSLHQTETTIEQLLFGNLKNLANISKESIVRNSVDQAAAQVYRSVHGCY